MPIYIYKTKVHVYLKNPWKNSEKVGERFWKYKEYYLNVVKFERELVFGQLRVLDNVLGHSPVQQHVYMNVRLTTWLVVTQIATSDSHIEYITIHRLSSHTSISNLSTKHSWLRKHAVKIFDIIAFKLNKTSQMSQITEHAHEQN